MVMEQHTQSDAKHPTRDHDNGSSRLYLWLVLAFLIGLFFITLSPLLQIHDTHIRFGEILRDLFGDILRDLGIALCISVLIALAIELKLSGRTFLSGLDAIMQRTVPKDVWQDFRQHVITQSMMFEDWSVTMKIEKTFDGIAVSATKVKYTIVALDDNLNEQHIVTELDSHRDLQGTSERFTSAIIGGDLYPSRIHLLCAGFLPNERTLDLPVKLAKRKDRVTIEFEFKESIKRSDVIVWWMRRATKNVTLYIESFPESWDVDVKTFRPEPPLEASGTNLYKWDFNGIMLPGQGFEIQIRPKTKVPTIKPPTIA